MSVPKLFSILDKVSQAEVLNDGFKNAVVDAITKHMDNPTVNINDLYSVVDFLGKICDDVKAASREKVINHITASGDTKTSFGQTITLRIERPFDWNKDVNLAKLDKQMKIVKSEYDETKAIVKKACERALEEGKPTPVPMLPAKTSVVVKSDN